MKNILKLMTGSVALSAALILFSTTASAAPHRHEVTRVVYSHHVAHRPRHVAYRPYHVVHRGHYFERHHGYHRHDGHHYR